MIHVYDKAGDYVATIYKQDKLAIGYRRHEPWLLLWRTGRVDRFETYKESRKEAQKSWPACTFSKE